MKKYKTIEQTFVISIDDEYEELAAEFILANDGLCLGICSVCPFSTKRNCFVPEPENRLEILKQMGVRK